MSTLNGDTGSRVRGTGVANYTLDSVNRWYDSMGEYP
jgi:hypothetical protein